MRVAIIGAGIAGLTAGLALARAGFSVEIFERAAALEEVGAGIQLSPNATRLLDRLGLLAALSRVSVEPPALRLLDARSGRGLVEVPLGESARRRFGAPYWTIHRADLQAVLLDAARRESAVALHPGRPVSGVAEEGDGVRVTAEGASGRLDVAIGADGIRSRIRTDLFGYPGPADTGWTAWRMVLAADAAPEMLRERATQLWLAPGMHVVHYRVRAGAEINVVAIAAGGRDRPAPPLERLPERLRAALSAGAWTTWPLLVVDPSGPWTRGRVALVGDAAHAMLPSAAQGGAQAIEDAVMLADSLAAAPFDPARALLQWERARRPRVLRIVREARRNLAIYELAGPLAAARNVVLALMPARFHLARLDWLYGAGKA